MSDRAPNIILILTDDHGWTSVSYRSDPKLPGSKSDYVETPHMARAARNGMRFTDAYSPSAQCSPTRHGILFGQNAARHIYGKDLDWINKAPNWLTIPKALKKADKDYRAAHFGKWHVAVMPEEAGFDFSDGPTSNGHGDTQGGKYKDTKDVREKLKEYNADHGIIPPTLNSSYSKPPVYYSDDDPKGAVSMTRRAADFMSDCVGQSKPFFAYIAHFATHLDLVANKETYEYFKAKKKGIKHDNPGFAAMAKDMDTAIGEVFKHVKKLGIEDNTYIFIMSDNGGVQHFIQSASVTESGDIAETHETSVVWRNLPLRHGKHEYYEGGIRVPFLVVGPNIKPNSVCRVPVTGLDYLPTFAELAGMKLGFGGNLDGGSFLSLLHNGGQGKVRRKHEALFFHQGARREPLSAIRKGNYKLVKHWLAEEPVEGLKYRGEKTLELYDLSKDLGENKDLSGKMPELTNALHDELMEFLKQAGAETEYTKRWDAFDRMKKKRGIDFDKTRTIEPLYSSPFERD
jgi:arylsulfatase A-like enzyme